MDKAAVTLKPQPILWRWTLLLAAGLLTLGWLLNTPAGLLGKSDAVGYAVCHRIDVRSFHLGDRQLPLCARCTGMYLGAVLGLLFQAFIGRRRSGMPPWPLWIILGGFVVAFGIDGVNSYVNLIQGRLVSIHSVYEPQNWLRLFTGTGMGLTVSAALFPAFNQTIWQVWDPRPALANFKSLGVLVVLAIALDLLVLTENPLILYPLAIISSFGVLMLLTMVYSMVYLLIFRMDNRISTVSQLAFPLLAGFTIALMQIGLFDFARFQFTHTWGGFPITF